MDITRKDAVSFGDILAEVLALCNDEDFRNGYTRGWHKSGVQKALEALAFDTFYDEITIDVDIDQDCLQVEIPDNMFNPRILYAFNGVCDLNSAVKIYWKRTFNNKQGNGINYTADRRELSTNLDPFMPPSFVPSNVYWANIQNGLIMLSSNTRGFEKLRIIGNGAGSPIGDDPIIPRFFRQAIVDYCCERFFRAVAAKGDRTAFAMQKLYSNALYDVRDGSWQKAKNRVSMLSTWKRDSLKEYQEGMRDW